jgi:hypothetical protein
MILNDIDSGTLSEAGGEGRVFRATRTVGDRDVDVAMVKEAFGQILGLSSVPKDHGGEHPTSSPNSL